MLSLIYLPKRFSQKGVRRQETLYEAGRSYQYYLNRMTCLPDKFARARYDVIADGNVVKNLRGIPRRKSHIVVTPKIEWGALVVAAKAIWAAALAHPYIAWGTILTTSYSIYAAVSMRTRLPSFGINGIGADEGSPTYGWDGAKQTCDVGIPVNVIYGEYRIGGNVINEYVSTDGDKNFYHCLTCLGEGEIESISEGQVNKNPIENYEGVTATKRYGTNDQATIPGFEKLHNLSALIDVQMVQNDPYVYTTVDSDVEEFEVHFSFPQGIYQTDQATGEMTAWAVTYRVEYKLHTDGSYTDLGTFTVNEKNRATIRRIFRKSGLTAGQYDIRVTRTSADSGAYTVGDMYLQYFDEVKYQDISYVNRAVVGVDAIATNQLSNSAPNITWLVKGKKVLTPAVLNGSDLVPWDDYYWDPDADCFKLLSDGTALTWDGATYVTAYSANPIWCCRDLLTATRYGLGKFLGAAVMDDDRLLEMAKRCEERVADGKGGYEKRYRLDINIDTFAKAMDLLVQMSAAYDAFPYYSGETVGFVVDRPLSVPSQIFGMGNTIKNSFGVNSKSLSEIPNVIEVSFNDREKNYELDTIDVPDHAAIEAGEPVRTQKIRVFCTRASQAIRAGRYALYVAKYINRTLTFKTTMGALLCQVGDRVDYSHDVPLWGWSGNLRAGSTTTTLALDRTVTVESGKTYQVRVCYGADVIETRTVTSGVGDHTSITVSAAFTSAPEAGASYHFGEINVVDKPFRIISTERFGNGQILLNAIEYDERVYSETAVELPDNRYSSLSFEIPPITDLTLTERLVKLKDGKVEDCIDVWFQKPSPTSRYLWAFTKAKIYLSDDGGLSWTYRGETSGNSFSIVGGLVDNVAYTVAVVSNSSLHGDLDIDDAPQGTITLAGKSAAPSDVPWFIVRQSRDKAYFYYGKVSDLDVLPNGYEIRYGNSWASGEVIDPLSFIPRTGSAQSFWIKAKDTSGNYSENAVEGLITIANIPFTNIIESYSEQPTWGGTKSSVQVDGSTGNLIITSGSFLTGTYITPVRDVGFVATFKIGIEAVATVAGDDTFQDFGEQGFQDLGDSMRFSGAEQGGALGFEIKTSNDNIAWSDWEDWQPGDYTCRYFQLRMTMTRASASQNLSCSQLNYYADLPDVDETGEFEITVAANGAEIVFTKEYHKVPSVNIDLLSGDGFVHKFSVAPDLTGFTDKFYDLAGVAKTGTGRYHAHGV